MNKRTRTSEGLAEKPLPVAVRTSPGQVRLFSRFGAGAGVTIEIQFAMFAEGRAVESSRIRLNILGSEPGID